MAVLIEFDTNEHFNADQVARLDYQGNNITVYLADGSQISKNATQQEYDDLVVEISTAVADMLTLAEAVCCVAEGTLANTAITQNILKNTNLGDGDARLAALVGVIIDGAIELKAQFDALP
jgi:hypothetical protein